MQIAAGIPVDIMPGEHDPANFAMPQQVFIILITFLVDILFRLFRLSLTLSLFPISCKALNRCLFPGSAAFNTFRSCTNPHSFELDDVR